MISIITPYQFSETTLTSLAIANQLCQFDTVKIFATKRDKTKKMIHPYWDKHVCSYNNFKSYQKIYNSKIVIYCDPELSIWTKFITAEDLTAIDASLLCVLHRNGEILKDKKFIKKFKLIISPSRFINIEKKPIPIVWTNFISDINFAPREGFLYGNRTVSILMYLTPHFIKSCGMQLIKTINELIIISPNKCLITIAASNRLPNKMRKFINKLRNNYKNHKIFITKINNYIDLISLCHQHDWFFYGAIKPNFPVITFDVPPCNEIIINNKNGLLIPCPYTNTKGHLLPNAKYRNQNVCSKLLEIVKNNKILLDLQTVDWHIKEHQNEFHKLWENIVEIHYYKQSSGEKHE